MAEDSDSEKTEDPTQKRLTDARDKGQVAVSREVNHWFMILAGTIMVMMFLTPMMKHFGNLLLKVIEQPHASATDKLGLRALMTAIGSDNIVGIVAYENVGYVFPEGEGPDVPVGPYGPIEVPLADFRRLTRIPLQMVWGDNTDKTDRYDGALEQMRRFVELVNEYGGHAEVLMLPDAGLHGNTHIPFADLNNVAVADLLSTFLRENGLDAF